MHRSTLALATMTMTAALLALAPPTAFGQADDRGRVIAPSVTRIAVVDLSRLYKECEESRYLEKRLNAQREGLRAELVVLRDNLRILKEAKEQLPARSEEAKRLQDEQAVLKTRFEVTKRRLEKDLQASWKDSKARIARTLRLAISREARRLGYGAVLRKVDPADEAALATSGVVYAGGLDDVTDAVLRRMNRAFRERKKLGRKEGEGPR